MDSPEAWSSFRAPHREAMERFIVFWGDMASSWGINRTMAQIHALLLCSDDPLDTDTIMQRLRISRGNANMNLRSLVGWNLIRKMHLPGERKDYYAAEKDVWEITAQVLRERERREIQPVLHQIEACRAQLRAGASLNESEKRFDERLGQFIDLMRMFETVMRAILPLVQSGNTDAIRLLLGAVQQALPAETRP